MSITVDLTPELEARLRGVAAQQGKDAADVLAALVETLPPTAPGATDTAALSAPDPVADFQQRMQDARRKAPDLAALLEEWQAEGAALTDAERNEAEAQEAAPSEGLTWGARTRAALKADGVIGIWQDRPESNLELAAEFRRMAETRGPQPCD